MSAVQRPIHTVTRLAELHVGIQTNYESFAEYRCVSPEMNDNINNYYESRAEC